MVHIILLHGHIDLDDIVLVYLADFDIAIVGLDFDFVLFDYIVALADLDFDFDLDIVLGFGLVFDHLSILDHLHILVVLIDPDDFVRIALGYYCFGHHIGCFDHHIDYFDHTDCFDHPIGCFDCFDHRTDCFDHHIDYFDHTDCFDRIVDLLGCCFVHIDSDHLNFLYNYLILDRIGCFDPHIVDRFLLLDHIGLDYHIVGLLPLDFDLDCST